MDHLGTGSNWPTLWHLNPQIHNPNLIYPGEVLLL
jgi:nucleoid-associated protein YgaU